MGICVSMRPWPVEKSRLNKLQRRAHLPVLTVEVLASLAELDGISESWQDLWRRCPDSTLFQSPAWLLSWWRHLGQGQLLTLVLRPPERTIQNSGGPTHHA